MLHKDRQVVRNDPFRKHPAIDPVGRYQHAAADQTSAFKPREFNHVSATLDGPRVGGPFALSGVLSADLEAELLGDHSGLGQKLDPRLADALAQAMTEMNGEGIWRNPSARGVGGKSIRRSVHSTRRNPVYS